jgi:hypothetical protein
MNIMGTGRLIAAKQTQVAEAGTVSNVTLRREPKAVSRTTRAELLKRA